MDGSATAAGLSVVAVAARAARRSGYITARSRCKKTHIVLRQFILKMINLPRQAWDKHRESTQKRDLCVFLQPDNPLQINAFEQCEKRLLCEPFYAESDHFTKTGSGQTSEKLREKVCFAGARPTSLQRSSATSKQSTRSRHSRAHHRGQSVQSWPRASC
jgi:hypothetical protein